MDNLQNFFRKSRDHFSSVNSTGDYLKYLMNYDEGNGQASHKVNFIGLFINFFFFPLHVMHRLMTESVGGTMYFFNPDHPPPNPGNPVNSHSGSSTPAFAAKSHQQQQQQQLQHQLQQQLRHQQQPAGGMFPPYNLYPGPLPHLQHMRPKSNAPSFFLADEIKAELLHRQALTLVQLDPSLNTGTLFSRMGSLLQYRHLTYWDSWVFSIFRCAVASLYEVVSVGQSVGQSVGPSVGPLVPRYFGR